MKSFKQFLDESQWMYHGSTKNDLTHLKPDRSEYMVDRAIGSHFAADPSVSQRFATGSNKSRTPDKQGTVYRTKAPPRSQLKVIRQKVYPHGAMESDQNAIDSHVLSTVMSRPENKDLLVRWAKRNRNLDDKTAEDLHAHLSAGKAPADRERFGTSYHRNGSFRSFFSNYGTGLYDEGMRKEVVDKYLGIMREKGIKGLVYHNTAPMETEHLPSDNPKSDRARKAGQRGSRKSYVIFDPEHHQLEKT